MDATPRAEPLVPAMQWWESRRLRYNGLLIAAMVLGWFAYLGVVDSFAHIIAKPIVDEDGYVVGNTLEFEGVTVLIQCCGISFALLLANLFYLFGAGIERLLPATRVERYRVWAWRIGVGLSCFLPFSVALIHLVLCLFAPDWYDRASFDAAPSQGRTEASN